jgi:hypothetical protein
MGNVVYPTIAVDSVEPHYSIHRRFLPPTTLDREWVAAQLAWRDRRLAALEQALVEFRWETFVPNRAGDNTGNMVYVNDWVRARAAAILKEKANG